jgi:hypothetical protein
LVQVFNVLWFTLCPFVLCFPALVCCAKTHLATLVRTKTTLSKAEPHLENASGLIRESPTASLRRELLGKEKTLTYAWYTFVSNYFFLQAMLLPFTTQATILVS